MARPLRSSVPMRSFTRAAFACLFVLASCAKADTILCVGINQYANYPDLKHAENDAVELGTLFRSLGHEVIMLTGDDVTTRKLQDALRSEPAFFYFAGHGRRDRLIVRDGNLTLTDMAGPATMMLLDCCYVGRGLKATGTTKILAAAEYEAFEDDGHGLFTKYLLNWLKDGKGLSESALTNYLTENIARETGGWQKPVLGYI